MITLTTPRNANEALAQAVRMERAEQIIRDGYSFFPDTELDMIAICKPGSLHADYQLTEGGTVCDCKDFAKTGLACKHIIANSIVVANNIPTIASTSLDTIRRHVEERDREAIAIARMAEMDADAEAAEVYPY